MQLVLAYVCQCSICVRALLGLLGSSQVAGSEPPMLLISFDAGLFNASMGHGELSSQGTAVQFPALL